MIEASTFVKERLSATNAEGFLLVTFLIPGANLGFTDLGRDATVNGLVYKSTGDVTLTSVSMPETDGSVDKTEYSLEFSDLQASLESHLVTNNSQNSTIRVSVGFVDPATDKPELNDTLVVYEGLYSTQLVEDDGATRRIVVKLGSPMSALDFYDPVVTSPDSITRFDSTDTSMDFIGEQSEEDVELGWGKKQ
jgi:hypothetical protein